MKATLTITGPPCFKVLLERWSISLAWGRMTSAVNVMWLRMLTFHCKWPVIEWTDVFVRI